MLAINPIYYILSSKNFIKLNTGSFPALRVTGFSCLDIVTAAILWLVSSARIVASTRWKISNLSVSAARSWFDMTPDQLIGCLLAASSCRVAALKQKTSRQQKALQKKTSSPNTTKELKYLKNEHHSWKSKDMKWKDMKSKRTYTMHGWPKFLLFQYSVRCAMYCIGLLHREQPWMDSRIWFIWFTSFAP